MWIQQDDRDRSSQGMTRPNRQSNGLTAGRMARGDGESTFSGQQKEMPRSSPDLQLDEEVRHVAADDTRTREPDMMTASVLTSILALIGVRSVFTHREIMELIELLRILGNSYRIASSGVGSGLLYVRFALYFCRTIAWRSPNQYPEHR